ncbi:hypothetical protein J2S00_003358 [Caldalkalibacillus uzonensis]|uniref:Uncharacterized protein n=1 Tax=Caldalkalibacillus uzonensis TaxID=353224 RepID=A0ABU0CX64_9BACI|nr:hypothetical protein [Caldalkalibacillus uzonensis]MDQ0340534.1 hypothetical protein [Caldalkalibacillus uzonensis]
MGTMAILWYAQWFFWTAVIIGIYFWHKNKHKVIDSKKSESKNV